MYKIVQSYWSKPSLDSENVQEESRFKGGWLHEKYNYMSWAFSCLKLRQYYNDVVLYTDDLGKELLINELELPYTNVRLDLNDLKTYDSRLWAVGKLYTYSLQNEPFIHVDGDVYIWDKFNISLEKRDVIVQSKYDFTHHIKYEEIKTYLLQEFKNLPFSVSEQLKKENNQLLSINAGIIGGSDIAFFRNYTTEAFRFLHANVDKIEQIPIDLFNMIFEEVLFFCMASQYRKDVACLFPEMDNEFTKITCLHLVPKIATYIHLVGYAKKDKFACQQVERRLRYEFPDYYKRIQDYISTQDQEPVPIQPTFNRSIKNPVNPIENEYPRTTSLLKFINLDLKYHNFDALAERVEQIAETQTDYLPNALRAIFNLEKAKQSFFKTASQRDVQKINEIYSFLDTADIDTILRTPFIISSSAAIVECEWYMKIEDAKVDRFADQCFFSEREDNHFVLFYLDDDHAIIEEVLQGWNVFLSAFAEPTTGNEIVAFLIEKYKQSEQSYDLDELKLNVVDLINRHLVMEGILDFAA